MAGPTVRARVRFERDERIASIVSNWPSGATAARDLGTNYLSYPLIGAPERVTFTHAVASFEEPDHEWIEHILLTLTVGAAP